MTWLGQKGLNANALVRMRVRIHSNNPADAFASLSAFSTISRILCACVRIPDRILIPALQVLLFSFLIVSGKGTSILKLIFFGTKIYESNGMDAIVLR